MFSNTTPALLSAQTLAAIVGLSLTGSAMAAGYTIDWMQHTPYAIGGSVPSGQTFSLPGVGPVVMTYSSPPSFSNVRGTSSSLTSGSVNATPDTYSWSNYEYLGRTNFSSAGHAGWSVTYTFLAGPLAPGTIVLGVSGLGTLPAGITTASVAQQGTYLGEWGGGNPGLGPNAYTGGVGNFSLQNALPGNGIPGDPSFNTRLAVVRIDDPLSSLTVNFDQIGQDGVGVDIGVIPTPGTITVAGLASTCLLRRRRPRTP